MKQSKANRRILFILGMAGLVAIAGLMGRLGPVSWVYDHTAAPIGRSLAAVGTNMSATLSNISQVKNLAAQNQALEAQNAQLRQRLAGDAEAARDNALLRAQLGLEVAGTPAQVLAEVVAFQPDAYRQFITINKGSQSGLRVGQAAMNQGVLIGLVSSISATTAKIMLVTDPDFRLVSKDQDTNATGLLVGQLGGGLELTEIGQTDAVRPGDTVTTSGLGGVVPAGLYIGQVQSVDTKVNVVFQSAELVTSLQPNQLRFISVVTGS